MHERIKIYREFYHCIIYIANEGRHVRIKDNFLLISLLHDVSIFQSRNKRYNTSVNITVVHDVSIFQSRNKRAKSLPLVLGAPLDGEQGTTLLLISLVHDVSIFQSRNKRAKSLPLVLGAPLDGEQGTTLLLISLWYMMFLYFRVVIRELRVYL